VQAARSTVARCCPSSWAPRTTSRAGRRSVRGGEPEVRAHRGGRTSAAVTLRA
jgi:hypothetical protein